MILYGNSWGGMLAAWYVDKYPARVIALILGEPGPLSTELRDKLPPRGEILEILLEEMLNDWFYAEGFLSPSGHSGMDYFVQIGTLEPQPERGSDGTVYGKKWRPGAAAMYWITKDQNETNFDYTANLMAYPNKVLIVGTLSYLYIIALLDRVRIYKIRNILHFVPFIIALVINVFFNTFLDNIFIAVLYYIILKSLAGLIYLTVTLWEFNRHRDYIFNHYSYRDGVDYKWLRYLFISEFSIWVLYFVFSFFFLFSISITAYTDITINNLIAVFIIFIGFNGIRNTVVFTRTREIEGTVGNKEGKLAAESKSMADYSIDYPLMEQYFKKLELFMNQEKPF